MEHQVFLSYSTKDFALAEKLYGYLTGQGLLCWMAPRSIAPGEEYGKAIIAGIEQAKVFVLLYSENSNQSQHVLREVERCVNKNIPLIAYKVGEVQPTKSMEYFLMANQWMQAADAPEGHMGELCGAIRQILGQDQGERQKAEIPGGKAGKEEGQRAGSRRGMAKIVVAACLLMVVAAAAFWVQRTRADGGKTGNPDVAQKADGDGTKTPGPEQEEDGGGTEPPSFTQKENDNGPENPGFVQTGDRDGTKNPDTGQKKDGMDATSLAVGDYLTFGRYYPQGQEGAADAEIGWIVISVDEKAGTALLLTEKLIDMKPYDVAESGVYGRGVDGQKCDREKLAAGEYPDSELSVYYGNNSWKYSNLRAWLNCADGVVEYGGQEPVSKGTDDGVNGYQNQAGFLHDFTKEELACLVETEVETPENSIGNGGATKDLVFLLSVEEAARYLDGQKISRYAAPTDAAVAASRGTIYPLYHSYSQETIPWYFRTPAEGSAHEVMTCGSGFEGEGDVIVKYACSAGCGVRPAVVVKLPEGGFTGTGTRTDPYRTSRE